MSRDFSSTGKEIMGNAMQHILAVDIGGRPYDWLHWQQVVRLYARDEIAWETGDALYRIRGGINSRTRARSVIQLNSIVSVQGANSAAVYDAVPALSNRALFARDEYLCMYCGEQFPASLLTRDHIMPRAQGGQDLWDNVITACKSCNNRKGSMTPEQAGMPILAVPYVPNHAEYLILANRRMLADQMVFLRRYVPRARR
jgi:5-methylcytosine-specific restriction endonuclease McrA